MSLTSSSADTVHHSLNRAHHPAYDTQLHSGVNHAPGKGRESSADLASTHRNSSTPGEESMNVPNLSFYDPEQVIGPEENGQYQQWLQNYYPPAEPSAPYAHLTNGLPNGQMSQLPYESMGPSISHPQMQNQYNFAPSQYTAQQQHQRHQPTAYNQGYPVARSVDRTGTVGPPPRISRPVSHSQVNNVNQANFRQPHPHMGYQQQQQQPTQTRYPPPQQDGAASVSYFPPTNAPDVHRGQDFTFTYGQSVEPRHTPVSAGSYTPNSDTNPLPPSNSNTSPSSWGGGGGQEDGGAQFNAYVPPSTATSSGTAPGTGQNTNASPGGRREVPTGKGRNKKRPRTDPSVNADLGSDSEDNDGPQSAVAPLRGPDTNPTRLCVPLPSFIRLALSDHSPCCPSLPRATVLDLFCFVHAAPTGVLSPRVPPLTVSLAIAFRTDQSFYALGGTRSNCPPVILPTRSLSSPGHLFTPAYLTQIL
ncbi:hypothetical protein BDW22DRAFT_1362439 [Trametopsis cervina]|nr:hypothetical protein BDW22DRAFT_1362439 [Trametopsis cervina]